MKIYEKVAADKSSPRDVRARALLRLGGCEEKLGRQAKQTYEQIVRDFADLPPADLARKRLALLKKQENPATPTTMSIRKIEWARLGQMEDPDTDGEQGTFVSTSLSSRLADLCAFIGAKRRPLTAAAAEGTAASAAPVPDATTENTLHPQDPPFLHDPICNRKGCRRNPFRGGVSL